MLETFGLGRLVQAVALPAAATPAAAMSGSNPARRSTGDLDATLAAGRPSGMSLEPSVTLEGIASTLSRIYAQVA